MANFPGMVALTGSSSELAGLQTAFGVVAHRHELANGDNAIDHTAAVHLVNAQRKIQLVYPQGTGTVEIAAVGDALSPTAPSGRPRATSARERTGHRLSSFGMSMARLASDC